MPIVDPGSLQALGLVPFQVNVHYPDGEPTGPPGSETRQERIAEFLEENDVPVLGLREGTWLRVSGEVATLGGGGRRPALPARRRTSGASRGIRCIRTAQLARHVRQQRAGPPGHGQPRGPAIATARRNDFTPAGPGRLHTAVADPRPAERQIRARPAA
jgi:Peptidase family S51